MLTKFLKKHFPDSGITKFWENPRKRAVILLPFWIIFIIVVLVIYIIPYNEKLKQDNSLKNNVANETITDNQPKPSADKISTMWQDLLNMEYEYKILAYKGEDIVEYEGIKAEGDISGTKSDDNGVSEYYIQGDNIYNVVNDNASLYGLLSQIQYEKYLDPKLIYEDIKNITPTFNDYEYIYENSEYYVIISAEDYIKSIEVDLKNEMDSETVKYILNFTKIG